MTNGFRLTTENEYGEVVLNEIFNGFRKANLNFRVEVKNKNVKRVLLHKVYFDENGDLIREKDERIMACSRV